MVGVILRIEHLNKALDLLVVSSVILVEVADVLNDLSHLMNRVIAALRSAAVAGNAANIDANFHTAAMTAIDAAVGGLGGDDEFDLAAGVFRAVKVFVYDGLPAHAVAVFFLNGANDHDFITVGNETEILHNLCAVCSGSHAAFLIGTAAAVNNGIGFIALIRICFPVVDVADTNGVNMRVDSDDLVAGAHPADNIAELVKFDLVIAELVHFLCDTLYNALFFAALAGNGDHIAKETAHVCAIAFGSFFDCFKIHNIPSIKNTISNPLFCGTSLYYHICNRCQTNFL